MATELELLTARVAALAGVLGLSKFVYDLWGDAVNVAARMESHGEPGAIQVTEETHARLKDSFRFDERGVVDVKGKGPMKTFFLRARLPPAPPR